MHAQALNRAIADGRFDLGERTAGPTSGASLCGTGAAGFVAAGVTAVAG